LNHTKTARVFYEAAQTLWSDFLIVDNMLLLVTDATLYMTKSEDELSLIYAELLRVMLVEYALYRICITVHVLV
jgi:hypothetical protein